jgi:hypothetical protein
MEIRYRLYPSLLNCYARYEAGKLTVQELLDRINRVPVPQTNAQARGVSFEEAVIKGTDEALYNPEIVSKVRSLLPRPMVATQVFCQYQSGNVLIYGYVDLIGRSLAVDIKTTSRYYPDRYVSDHQNFYIPALRSKGIRSLRYVITDFEEVYQEEYDLFTDFSVQERQMAEMCDFLENNRHLIYNPKVFGS